MKNPTQSRLINEVIANSRPVADRSAYLAAIEVLRAASARHNAAAVEFSYGRITTDKYLAALEAFKQADRAVSAVAAVLCRD